MGKVKAGATVSLDGFIAGPNDTGFDKLFKWYGAGDVEVPMPDSTAQVPASRVSADTAALLRREMEGWGALVVGRHLYDLTNAWNGRHPLGVTTVVLTHHPPEDRPLADDNFVFVTDGIEAAVGGALTGMAVIGSTIYPPAMGLLSVTVGLTVAMLGNAVLAVACVFALMAFGRATVARSTPEPLTSPGHHADQPGEGRA